MVRLDSSKAKQRASQTAAGVASGKLAAAVLADMPAPDHEQKPTDAKEKEPATIERPVPIWSILPPIKNGGRCPWTGLTRSILRDVTRPTQLNDFNPPVRSVIRVRPGGARGRVFFKLRGAGGLLE